MSAQAESININRQLYHEWFPQIIYNHHQTGPDGHDPVRAALPRSGQLRLSPADHHRPRRGGLGDAQPLRRREQARRHDAPRRELLDVVERRPAHVAVLPQHDRPAHRIDRPSDADGSGLRSGSPDGERRSAVPDRAAEVALPPVHRLLDHRELGGARRGVAQPRDLPLQHLQDGQGQHRQGIERHLDDVSAPPAGHQGRDREEPEGRCGRSADDCRRPRPEHRAAGAVREAREEARVARSARLHPVRRIRRTS